MGGWVPWVVGGQAAHISLTLLLRQLCDLWQGSTDQGSWRRFRGALGWRPSILGEGVPTGHSLSLGHSCQGSQVMVKISQLRLSRHWAQWTGCGTPWGQTSRGGRRWSQLGLGVHD